MEAIKRIRELRGISQDYLATSAMCGSQYSSKVGDEWGIPRKGQDSGNKNC